MSLSRTISHSHHENSKLDGATSQTPTALKVHKASPTVKKPSLIPSTSASHHQRQPVIIYTHSPKVIHTHANDFKALVQKLTGLSKTDADNDENAPKPTPTPTPSPPKQYSEETVSSASYSESLVTDFLCPNEPFYGYNNDPFMFSGSNGLRNLSPSNREY